MAFVSVAGGGTGVIAGASASSFTLTTTAAIDLSTSRFCLVSITTDNIATADGASNNHTSITGGAGTWTKLNEYTNNISGAATGICSSVWLFIPSGANAIGTVFTITLSAAVVDACAQCRIFSWDSTKGIRQTTEAAAIGNGVDASNGFGSVAFSGLTSLARLYFRSMGKEANSTTNVTASTGFSAGTSVRSRNNAAAVLDRTEWRINTSTGETSNPTLAVSGDTASNFIALEEYVLGGGDVTVSITGHAASAAAGSLSPAMALAITGQAASVSSGNLTPENALSLTGLSMTASQGTVSVGTGDVTVAITGHAISAASGSLSIARSVAATGQSATVAQGSVGAAVSLAITGHQVVTFRGSVAVAGAPVIVATFGRAIRPFVMDFAA